MNHLQARDAGAFHVSVCNLWSETPHEDSIAFVECAACLRDLAEKGLLAGAEPLSPLSPEQEKLEDIIEALDNRVAALKQALLDACDGWERLYTSDYNDDPPDEIAELRGIANNQIYLDQIPKKETP